MSKYHDLPVSSGLRYYSPGIGIPVSFPIGFRGVDFMKIEHVDGKDAGKLMLYALSTCGHCRNTKKLLTDLGIEYDYLFVDLLQGQEKEQAIAMVEKWNPDLSFPTIVINDSKCIVGFKEDDIKAALKL
jgi:glutaredoxin